MLIEIRLVGDEADTTEHLHQTVGKNEARIPSVPKGLGSLDLLMRRLGGKWGFDIGHVVDIASNASVLTFTITTKPVCLRIICPNDEHNESGAVMIRPPHFDKHELP